MDFIPYKVNEYLENTFYQVPKELFTNPYYKKLNSDSKLLYALLLDRLSVSMKNEWIDEDGNIFLIFSRKEAGEKLNLSDKTVTKAFRELNNVKLMYEKRLGFRKKNIIYVGKIKHISTEKIMSRKITSQETENLRIKSRRIYDVVIINIIKLIIVIRPREKIHIQIMNKEFMNQNN